MEKKFREIKHELRILGIDDGSFTPRKVGLATIIGLVFRGGLWIDGAMKTDVEIDGLDATNKICSMIKSSPHYDQLRVIMLNGLTFAGFNIVNIKRVFESTGLPVIVLTKKKPNINKVKNALKKLSNSEERWKTIQEAGDIAKLDVRRSVYMQLAGISRDDAEKIYKISCTRNDFPEPLNVAHVIASGLTKPITVKRKKI